MGQCLIYRAAGRARQRVRNNPPGATALAEEPERVTAMAIAKSCLISALLLSSAIGLAGGVSAAQAGKHRAGHPVGLGKVVTTKDGGQLFGFATHQGGEQ